MKAAIYPGEGRPISIETLADPEPGPDDVLIRVHRCGICGTDLSMTRGTAWDYGKNVQFGHEYAGEIVEVGRNVSRLKVGDRISVLPSSACGHCEVCEGHGNHVLCRNDPTYVSVGFAELARVPAYLATPLPSTLSLADGALIEPMAISLYGTQMAAIRPGERVLVLGGGSVALYAIYWARRLGAGRIVAMSRSARRRDMALQMGADDFIPFGDGETGAVTEALGGAPQIVLECVGAEGMMMKAMTHAGLFGRIISLGFCTSPDPVIPAIGSYKCLSLHFAVGYRMQEFLHIADQMDKGHCDPKLTISSQIPLDELPAMMETLRGPNDETKVHVLCN